MQPVFLKLLQVSEYGSMTSYDAMSVNLTQVTTFVEETDRVLFTLSDGKQYVSYQPVTFLEAIRKIQL